MIDFITFFENITSLQRAVILVGGITFFWSIESIIPLFNFNYKKIKHASTNLFFTFTTTASPYARICLIKYVVAPVQCSYLDLTTPFNSCSTKESNFVAV